MRSASVILISLASLAARSGVQQQPPATEVYLVAWSFDKAKTVVGPVVNVSNSPGYDNQPSFLPDGSGILFTSNRDGKQTDIYRYDFSTRAVTQLTRTSEGEYSPLVTPDGKSFSVIRTEADGTQRLWRFDLDGTNPRLVLEDVKPVGYHVWIDATHLALFILGGQGQPNTLQLADTTTGKADVIDSRIGRSLHRRPGTGTISYVSQPAGERWLIKEFDPKTREIRTIVETVDPKGQDCAWDPAGRLLMASGSKLFDWSAADGWREVGDLSAHVGAITRIAAYPAGTPGRAPGIVIVAEPRAK